MRILLTFIAMMTANLAAAEPTKEELLSALREDSSDSWALFNLGMMNYLADDFSGAAKYWKTLSDLHPTDWQVREKLVQAYWGFGDSKAANSEIGELRKGYESGEHAELNEKGFFICDQFHVEVIRVFVREYYELKGERPPCMEIHSKVWRREARSLPLSWQLSVCYRICER